MQICLPCLYVFQFSTCNQSANLMGKSAWLVTGSTGLFQHMFSVLECRSRCHGYIHPVLIIDFWLNFGKKRAKPSLEQGASNWWVILLGTLRSYVYVPWYMYIYISYWSYQHYALFRSFPWIQRNPQNDCGLAKGGGFGRTLSDSPKSSDSTGSRFCSIP